jgi:phospholipid/cholesterol/gamma-HCH transport system permease protein
MKPVAFSAAASDAVITLKGRITAYNAAPIWQEAIAILTGQPGASVRVDASHLVHIDDVGIALLFDLTQRERPTGAEVHVEGLAPKFAALIQGYDSADLAQAIKGTRRAGTFEHLGRATADQMAYASRFAGFVGRCAAAFATAFWQRGTIRWSEVRDVATEAGANAVPIVLLVGFLIGLIIAYEMGRVALQFGAVIFVVNGVGVAMLRELGPLMTAIVFAGRTGAAFAAQIGTQKVNEEINAISTFGLDPVHFLVVPRLIAAALVLPLLVVFADIVGLFGGALVMATFNIDFLQFYNHLLGAVDTSDFLIGIAKAATFGLAIAAIGSERGLATGAGATSVGLSATGAVVASIVMIVVIDGIFTVVTS